MKSCFILILLAMALFNCKAQNYSTHSVQKNNSTKNFTNPEQLQILQAPAYLQKPLPDSIIDTDYDAGFLYKSRLQKINGLVLIAGGSVISAAGLRYNIMRDRQLKARQSNEATDKFKKNNTGRLAFSSLVMMAGSIPYFICSLRNKNKKGLKLTSQNMTTGTSNKGCKRVTSLTFGIPIKR